MPRADFVIRQGDYGQTMRATLTDEDDEAVDLAQAISVRLVIAPLNGGTAILDTTASIDQQGQQDVGEVSYEFQQDDSASAGHYLAEWEVTWPDAIVTFPNGGYTLIEITPQLAEDSP